MELLQTLVEKASPAVIAFFWGLAAGVLTAALAGRTPWARKFIQYVANTADEPNRPKRHYAT
jgi:hypothetical protein